MTNKFAIISGLSPRVLSVEFGHEGDKVLSGWPPQAEHSTILRCRRHQTGYFGSPQGGRGSPKSFAICDLFNKPREARADRRGLGGRRRHIWWPMPTPDARFGWPPQANQAEKCISTVRSPESNRNAAPLKIKI
jgi:hypothetical protein